MAEGTQKGNSSWWAIVLVLLLLPVLYVLSLGPAVALVPPTGNGADAARVFYTPLIWLRENTPLRKPLEWDVELWEKK